jgi:2-polyprenyl-3-methyl-5-hydroxy-6-metoxy-1,4-benzoquinol methylase
MPIDHNATRAGLIVYADLLITAEQIATATESKHALLPHKEGDFNSFTYRQEELHAGRHRKTFPIEYFVANKQSNGDNSAHVMPQTPIHHYPFDAKEPCNAGYLNLEIIKELNRIGAKSVLDLGCGNGYLCRDLSNLGFNVTGVDPSSTGIAHARTLAPKVSFYEIGVYDNPQNLETHNYDAVVSTEVIEHLYYPKELIRFAKAVLKPGGYLVVTTPYHGYLKNLLLALFNKWDFHHKPLWDGGHVKYWSKKTLTEALENEGFFVENFIGCGRTRYLWKSMLLTARKA